MNGLLNFNIAFLLALVSGPALLATRLFAYKQLGGKPKVGEPSTFSILAHRLLPFYLWFGALTSQAHKEERFMFPAYGLLCFNAATCLYLIRGWIEQLHLKFVSPKPHVSMSRRLAYWSDTKYSIVGLVYTQSSQGLSSPSSSSSPSLE